MTIQESLRNLIARYETESSEYHTPYSYMSKEYYLRCEIKASVLEDVLSDLRSICASFESESEN